MVKLADLINGTKSGDVTVGDAAVKITWRVFWDERFTPADWDRLKALSGLDYFVEVVPVMLTAWDIVDSDGNPLPITAEAIRDNGVPVRFLAACEHMVAESRL